MLPETSLCPYLVFIVMSSSTIPTTVVFADGQTDRRAGGQTGIWTQTDKPTDRQTETDRQIGRLADKQIEHRHTDKQTNRCRQTDRLQAGKKRDR